MGIAVLLCSEQPALAQGLAKLLETDAPDLDVVGIATDSHEAERLARELSPDVALIGAHGTDSTDAISRVRSTSPDTRVVVLTVSDERADLHRALRAGAAGYVCRGSDAADVASVVRSVHRGHLVIPAHLVTSVLRDLEPADPTALSDTEREILAGIARGETNKEIAHRLHASERTVRRRIQGIYDKLHLSDRLGAAIYAAQRGIGSDGA